MRSSFLAGILAAFAAGETALYPVYYQVSAPDSLCFSLGICISKFYIADTVVPLTTRLIKHIIPRK